MAQTSKSFFEVLEDQIRTDLRREIEAEVRAEQERHASGGLSLGFAYGGEPSC